MHLTVGGGPFIVIGENIHATRTRTWASIQVIDDSEGRPGIPFTDAAGVARTMPIAAPIAASPDFAAGKVKHVRNAILLGLAGAGLVGQDVVGPTQAGDGETAAAYLLALARGQVATGAEYLDLNVDEIDERLEVRLAAMRWLVESLEPELEAGVRLAIDSSSVDVLEAGVRASRARNGAPLLNSASLDRLTTLNLAASVGSPVVLSATGDGGMPTTAAERVTSANRIVLEAERRGLPLDSLFVDPLVLPVAVDPQAGRAFLEAVSALRTEYGSTIHITGGISNVSFGLPGRRLLNNVFLLLAAEAGLDSGLIDPTTANVDRLLTIDRDHPAIRLATSFLVGEDEYGVQYMSAFRAGQLESTFRVL